ncbi:unnamed protein product [Ectocarpus sp. 8 AP-2014]
MTRHGIPTAGSPPIRNACCQDRCRSTLHRRQTDTTTQTQQAALPPFSLSLSLFPLSLFSQGTSTVDSMTSTATIIRRSQFIDINPKNEYYNAPLHRSSFKDATLECVCFCVISSHICLLFWRQSTPPFGNKLD